MSLKFLSVFHDNSYQFVPETNWTRTRGDVNMHLPEQRLKAWLILAFLRYQQKFHLWRGLIKSVHSVLIWLPLSLFLVALKKWWIKVQIRLLALEFHRKFTEALFLGPPKNTLLICGGWDFWLYHKVLTCWFYNLVGESENIYKHPHPCFPLTWS